MGEKQIFITAVSAIVIMCGRAIAQTIDPDEPDPTMADYQNFVDELNKIVKSITPESC